MAHQSVCIKTKRCVLHAAGLTRALVAEPGGPLPGHLHYPLALVRLARLLIRIHNNGLHTRGPQRTALHRLNLIANPSSLFVHFSITEATQDVFLLEVAALWTWLDVQLKEK